MDNVTLVTDNNEGEESFFVYYFVGKNLREIIMYKKAWIVWMVICLVVIPGMVLAQEMEPREETFEHSSSRDFSPKGGGGFEDFPGRKNLNDWVQLSDLASPASENSMNVVLGQPGLSFSYSQRFGVTTVGYFEDDNHFSQVTGIATDGNNLWIGDYYGNRALKFDSSGNKLLQIGQASFRDYYDDTSLSEISDVGVDSSGSVYLVDPSANHVAIFDSSGSWIDELGEVWNAGSSTTQLNSPRGIAFDASGNIYVSDYNNDRVQIFAGDRTYRNTILVDSPMRMAIYENELYVPSELECVVYIFNIANPMAPSLSATLGTVNYCGSSTALFNRPNGVAVNSNFIFVADRRNNRVKVYNRATRAYITSFGSSGSSNGKFYGPSDVALDAAGYIYVADRWNYRVQKFNSSYVYQDQYGTTGVPYLTDNFHYNYPTGVAVASDGSIYIVEERGHRLVKLNSSGVPQWSIGTPGVDNDTNDTFCFPNGVAVGPSGRVYVADNCNNRIQIFTAGGAYYNTISGLDYPEGVAIGSDERIYVANSGSNEIRVYNSSLSLLSTINVGFYVRDVAVDLNHNVYAVDNEEHVIWKCVPGGGYVCNVKLGVLGNSTYNFGYTSYPVAVAVDKLGRIYVAVGWGGRVDVYDANGAYLTSVGGSFGGNTGQMRQAEGLAVDASGSLYVAEYLNHRIQKFVPGTPYWVQKNINGFGDRSRHISSLASFGDHLYVGTYRYQAYGAHLWRMDAGGNWSLVVNNGFNKYYNIGIEQLVEFNGKLYAGIWSSKSDAPYTEGGEIWRSSSGDSGSWESVIDPGFGDVWNGEVCQLGEFDNQLYAATSSYTTTHGTEIWRSASGDYGSWSRVVTNGLGDATNEAILSFKPFNGAFFASTYSWDENSSSPAGAEIWRTEDGTSWSKVTDDCFNQASTCMEISGFEEFNGYLYVGNRRWDPATSTNPGGQIWRCEASTLCNEESDWHMVTLPTGMGKPDNYAMRGLKVYKGQLYVFASNVASGLEVWRTADGDHWSQVGFAGFGDSNNGYTFFSNTAAVFDERLFIGTINVTNQASVNGGEVWQFLDQWVFLPLILK